MQSSDSDYSPIKKGGRSRSYLVESSQSSSDDDSEIPVRKRKSRPRVSSSSSADSIILKKTHKKLRVLSDQDSDTSESSTDSEVEGVFRSGGQNKKPRSRTLDTDSDDLTKVSQADEAESGSRSSDDDSEKCIICFKAFRGAVAHPSGCKHTFHSECLLTWSKTSNTCPIDRVKYTQVIVTDRDGAPVSRHDVCTPPPQDPGDNIEPDDPTFCEICHQHDREDEMLLCDRCEGGYHLNCLDPPLAEVPVGDWYCPRCERNAVDDIIDADEIDELLREGAMLENRLRHRTAQSSQQRRVGPRTRAAQRVIAAIRQMAEQAELLQPGSSRTRRSTTGRSSRRKKTTSRNQRRTHYKVELVTVEDGSTIEVKVAVNTRLRRKKTKAKSSRGKHGSKRRSGGSARRGENLHARALENIGVQSLDIVGSRPQLEYFSGCEAEDERDEDGGGGLAALRARGTVTTARGMANRKQMAAQVLRSARPRRPQPRIAVSSAPPDLLSSILDEQAKWHAPNAVIKSNSEGEVKVILPEKGERSGVRTAGTSGGSGSAGGGGSGGGGPTGGGGSGGGGSSAGGSAGASGSSGGGGSSTSSGTSGCIPPLQPPPQPPVFSKVYEDDDFDLYADIEPPKLAPPPEPPALLLALEGDEAVSSPEDAQLVIDDRQTYDPDIPTSPPPTPPEMPPPGGALDLSSIRLPSPEPDIDDCPNRNIYSTASLNIAKEKEDSDEEMDLPKPPRDFIRKKKKQPAVATCAPRPNGYPVDGELDKDQETSPPPNEPSPKKLNNDSDKYDPELSDEEEEEVVDDEKVSNQVSVIKENEVSTVKEETEEKEIKMESEEVKIENKEVLDEKMKIEDVEMKEEKEIKAPEDADNEKKSDEVEMKDEPEDEIKIKDVETEAINKKMEDLKVEASANIGGGDDDEEEEGELKENNEEALPEEKEAFSVREVLDEERPPSPKSLADLDLSDEKINEKESGDEGKRPTTPPDKGDKDGHSSRGSTPHRKRGDKGGEDVLELREEDEKDGLVDITDEEISTYEKSWELEENQAPKEKTEGLEGLETEAISEGEDNIAEEGQLRTPAENGPKEEGEIISEEKRAPVAWKKVTKAKERSYREKDSVNKEKNKKSKEKKPKEKRKEIERYDVRKVISEKPRRRVDEFGRDISPSRSRSLSDSRSRSRSPSIVSRKKSRSRSRSRSRKRKSRSRERRNRSRGRSRGRSRERVKSRSRDRSKRRLRSKTRSRSLSRRRKSRSPRKKERRSRPKSREKKKRRRESSMSCSSCSCSSCERERRKSKKLTVIVPNEPAKKDKKKKKEKDLRRRRVDSPIPSKEVFTSGDNILVSVNFSKSSKSGEGGRKDKKKKDDESKKKKDKNSKENQPLRSIVSKSGSNQLRRNRVNSKNIKPVAIIDLATSPYREQALSPKEIIVLTDSDSEDKRKPDENNLPLCQITGPKTPPEPHIKFNIVNSKPQMLRSLTNPLMEGGAGLLGDDDDGLEEEEEGDEIPSHKGPNTPPEPPVPYDPFEPTKSRSPTPIQDLSEARGLNLSPGDKILLPESQTRTASPPKPSLDPPKTPSPLHSPPPKPKPPEDNPPVNMSPSNNCDDDYDMDAGGGDSPYSPGSSEGDEIFEPPLPQISAPLPIIKNKSRPPPKFPSKLTPSPLKRKPASKPMPSKKDKKSSLPMNEDQLKILDDLPNSAVEMQVKDKFLKKLNRQERVVEEVKLVLKPHYIKKHVTKEEYKEIMRKCVPKICHSRSGEINPLKIQRLIEAYIKKYRHLRKKRKMGENFTAPSLPLLKPKPTKATMWS